MIFNCQGNLVTLFVEGFHFLLEILSFLLTVLSFLFSSVQQFVCLFQLQSISSAHSTQGTVYAVLIEILLLPIAHYSMTIVVKCPGLISRFLIICVIAALFCCFSVRTDRCVGILYTTITCDTLQQVYLCQQLKPNNIVMTSF